MSEPGNPKYLDGASALEAGIPPRVSSVRSFTICPEPDLVRTSLERPTLSPPPLNSYDDSSSATWTPPETHYFSLPPSRPRPTQAVLATIGHSRTSEVNEPFPAFVDPANILINARTLLLDALHRRSTNDWSTHTDKQHFNSLFSRISPETGHIKTDEDLASTTKADLSYIIATGKTLRQQRGLGNAGKAVHLDGSTAAANGTPILHKDTEPRQLLRRKMITRAKQGITTALRFEEEFGIGFLRRQEASSDLRGEAPDRHRGRGRSRTRQPRRPPGVTREEVALSLSMLRESFPWFYDIIQPRQSSSLEQHDNIGLSRTKEAQKEKIKTKKTASTVVGQINEIDLQGGSSSSRSIADHSPSSSSTSRSESMRNPISFGGQQYDSLRIVEPIRRSNVQRSRIHQPQSSSSSSSVTAHYRPVSRFYEEEPDQYFEPQDNRIHPLQGGEYTKKSKVITKTTKVCTAVKKVSSMLKALAEGVGLRSSSSTKSSKLEERRTSDAESSRHALRNRNRHVDFQGQEEGIRGGKFRSTSSRLEVPPPPPSTTQHLHRTLRTNGSGLAPSLSQSSRYYASPETINANRLSVERPMTKARVVTAQAPKPRKLRKIRKA